MNSHTFNVKRRPFKYRQKEKHLKKFIWAVFLFFCVGGGVVVLLSKTQFLKVKGVSCSGGFESHCGFIKDELEGRFIFNLDAEKVRASILESDPEVAAVIFSSDLLGIVKASFTGRVPLATLVSSAGNFILDKDGTAFRQVESSGSAVPIYDTEISEPLLGSRIDSSKVLSALKALKALQEASFSVSSLYDKGDYLFVKLEGGLSVWLPYESDLGERSYSQLANDLRLIVDKAKVEKREFDKVDLRFSKITVE